MEIPILFSLHGDGELQEGQNWEAIMYASAKKVDNLIATVEPQWKTNRWNNRRGSCYGSPKSKV